MEFWNDVKKSWLFWFWVLMIVLAVINMAGCSRPHYSRSWVVVVSPKGEEIVSASFQMPKTEWMPLLLEELEDIFARWDVKFSASEGYTSVDLWAPTDNPHGGQAGYHNGCICQAEGYGVFVNNIFHDGRLIVMDKEFGVRYLAQVVAHEIGHSYGLVHNDDDYLYIMYIGVGFSDEKYWSENSVSYLDRYFVMR